jgi:hypothetical protein
MTSRLAAHTTGAKTLMLLISEAAGVDVERWQRIGQHYVGARPCSMQRTRRPTP